MTRTILHIIQQLSRGGAARSMIATAKYSSLQGKFQHRVISLLPANPNGLGLIEAAGITLVNAPDRNELWAEMANADIIQVHFWNSPELYEFLRLPLPPARLIIWFHVAGDKPPQMVTTTLVNFADFAIPCNPYSSQLPVFQTLPAEVKVKKIGMVYDAADFERLTHLQPKPHDRFNVGYIGTVDFVKMHRNYVPMSASIQIPNVRFIVCGGGLEKYLQQEAQQLGAGDRFEFRGYVEDIKSVIEILDVYGYPLCEDTYAAAELNLQEVMCAGIPPVVFPYGGVKRLIMDNYTGLIVDTELEYQQAIEYLYHNPAERLRLGKNAREYAQQIFGAENAAKQLNPIYEKLMQLPKRQRQWGIPLDTSILHQPISLADVTSEEPQPTGAELFIETLGDQAGPFIASMTAQNIEELWQSDRQIAAASPLLQSKYAGGIFQYRNYYPQDGYLKFWFGLVRQNQGKHIEALSEFTAAIQSGCNHWRLHWYIAQSAEKINDIPLATNALSTVVREAPDFLPAQRMLQQIKSQTEAQQQNIATTPGQSPVANILQKYEQNPSDANTLANVRQLRQQIAQAWLATPSEHLETAYKGDLGKTQRALLDSGLKINHSIADIPLTEAEQPLFQEISAKIVSGFNHPQALQSILAAILYRRAYKLPLQYQGAPIPKWFIKDFLHFLLETPHYFQELGEIDKYYTYLHGLIEYLHQRIFANPDAPIWQEISWTFAQNAFFLPLYFSSANLKDIYTKRSDIAEFALKNRGSQTDWQFPPRSPQRTKIRLGVLNLHFNPKTETFVTIPVIEYLNRDQFEIILYTIHANGNPLEQYCQSRADKFIKLTPDLNRQVAAIRNDDLDILFIGTNLTVGNAGLYLLPMHRLARLQVTSLSSPTTTGMPHIDCYIAGDLTAPPSFQDQYRELLVNIPGSGLCFHYPTQGLASAQTPAAMAFPHRNSLGITPEAVIFISGANFYKITPELRQTWAKIIAAVPNSVLLLYPFGPAWMQAYPKMTFIEQMQAAFTAYGIAPNRLKVLNTLPSRLEVKQVLQLGDIYLDSYPYSGATSLLDPLEVGLPPVVVEGNALRFRQASALLRELQITDLIATDDDSYIKLAIALGTNPQLRQQYRQQILEKMQANPAFLDSRTYGAKIGNLFQQLFHQWQLGRGEASAPKTLGETEKSVRGCFAQPLDGEMGLQSAPPFQGGVKEFINQLIGCANLHYIDPTDQPIIAELRQLRRELADFWLAVPPEQIPDFHNGDVGKAHQALIKSGFLSQPLTDEENSFLSPLLARLEAGDKAPGARNYILVAELYRQ
ncbi:MAG TPA: glycosyltransferase [Oscillatoriaceae cyanobacterium M33_DOE_052]|uniref:Glycosyltransferase n=1 Tax=Planktothricoides sp. SpSt-374 TaxID=2282167 RepID=A0A7C3ZW67_9CYAN|nr:glycosyltransferase [Oscillatoriaceae cyanobacterium M33_DOE_052]